MNAATRRMVRERAGFACEYCGLRESQELYISFHLDHVTALQHGGGDELENLAWSCHHCNFHKGTNLSSIDPETLEPAEVYHPRRHRWDEHFEQRGPMIFGKTPIGRATVRLLEMNAQNRIELRSTLAV